MLTANQELLITRWILDSLFPIGDCVAIKANLLWTNPIDKFVINVELKREKNVYSYLTFRTGTTTEEIANEYYNYLVKTLKKITALPIVEDWEELEEPKYTQYSLVIFNDPFPEDSPQRGQYPFKDGERLLLLGEIQQMPGHAVVVNKEGQVFWGYHTNSFTEVPEEEA